MSRRPAPARPAAPAVPTTRCAIYTRKSTEEGLEQEFNTLDAQRESGEAYIASQAGEGWTPPEALAAACYAAALHRKRRRCEGLGYELESFRRFSRQSASRSAETPPACPMRSPATTSTA